jgi:hypothetical protein
MRLLTVLLVGIAAAAGQGGPREIVLQSIAANEKNFRLARNYTFVERTERRSIDGAGNVKEKQSKTWDITLLEGSPYRRLLERDDKPLSEKEARKEQEKLDKSIAERRKETEAQRAKRVSEYERARDRERNLVREVADAFDFHIAGEERVDSRDVWMMEAMPRAQYQPRSRMAKALPHFKGKLWIDKASHEWVKVEAEAIDTVSFGFFLVRVERGAHMVFEQTRVNDEVWLPRRMVAQASARIGLIKKYREQVEVTYKNYRKFQTDARLVPAGETR